MLRAQISCIIKVEGTSNRPRNDIWYWFKPLHFGLLRRFNIGIFKNDERLFWSPCNEDSDIILDMMGVYIMPAVHGHPHMNYSLNS